MKRFVLEVYGMNTKIRKSFDTLAMAQSYRQTIGAINYSISEDGIVIVLVGVELTPMN